MGVAQPLQFPAKWMRWTETSLGILQIGFDPFCPGVIATEACR